MTPDGERGPLAARLVDARAAGRKLLVPFLTAGFPDADSCDAALAGIAAAGADAIELGVPFSDPLADGPVIAEASRRALAGGASLPGTIAAGARVTGANRPPIVLFTYLNPVLARGIDRVASECARAGFGGVLVADLPFDEAADVRASLTDRGLALVPLAAPTTPDDRLRSMARVAAGFIYLLARTGVTGSGSGADRRLVRQVAVLREETDLPIVVGFGIADADAARAAADVADGVVVGTALVERIGRHGPAAAVDLVGELRAALDRG